VARGAGTRVLGVGEHTRRRWRPRAAQHDARVGRRKRRSSRSPRRAGAGGGQSGLHTCSNAGCHTATASCLQASRVGPPVSHPHRGCSSLEGHRPGGRTLCAGGRGNSGFTVMGTVNAGCPIPSSLCRRRLHCAGRRLRAADVAGSASAQGFIKLGVAAAWASGAPQVAWSRTQPKPSGAAECRA
jgi:hypothetical protein